MKSHSFSSLIVLFIAVFLSTNAAAQTFYFSDQLNKAGTGGGGNVTLLDTSHADFSGIDDTDTGILVYQVTQNHDVYSTNDAFIGFQLYDGGSERLAVGNSWSVDEWGTFYPGNDNLIPGNVAIATDDPRTFTVTVKYASSGDDTAVISLSGSGVTGDLTFVDDESFDSVVVRNGNSGGNTTVDFTDMKMVYGDYIWDTDANGNWNADSNWQGTHPDAAGTHVILSNDITSDRTITLTSNHTVGDLTIIEDGANDYTVTGNSLTFDQSGDTANLNVFYSSSPTISSNVILNDNLVILQESSGTLTIDGDISDDGGAPSLSKSGSGTLSLTGSLIYTGDTTVSEGTLDRTGDWVIADASGSTQSTTVQSGAAITVSGETYVADDGTGTMTVTGSGSTFTGGTHISVGTNNGSVGLLTLSNAATLTSSDRLYVGDNAGSLGTLNITNGADAVAGGYTYVGHNGTGTMVISGDGSTHTGSNHVYVGAGGSSEGQLTLSNSATLTGSDRLYVANSAGSLGTVNITTGADALINGYSYIGNNGTGTMVLSGDGSTFTGVNHVYIANGSTGVGQLTLSDSATFTASNRLYLASSAAAIGTISITTGAKVTTTNQAYLGHKGTGTMVISGNGSNYTGLNQIHVGTTNGAEGQLTVSNTATLTASNRLYVGTDAGSNGTVSIESDADATISSQTYLGNNGTGTIVVSGNGSTYTGSDHIYVGVGSTGVGTLALSNSAAVTANKNLSIGDTAGANGTMTVESGGDVNVAWTTYVGKASTGALTVSGTNTSFASSGDIILGNSSSGVGTMIISSNGTVETNGKIKIGIAGGSGGTGSLTLQTTNGIIDASGMELGGGTFNPEGVTQAVGGLGALTMTEDSIIDMDGGNSIINWSVIDENTWTGTLHIHNWDGTKNTAGGNDQLIFADINGFNLAYSQVRFYSDSGSTFIGGGRFKANGANWELLPAPEPGTYIAVLSLISLILYRERKRISRIIHHSSG